MSKPKTALVAALTLLAAACSASSSEPAAQGPSPDAEGETAAATPTAEAAPAGLTGIYSEAQAERGGEVFTSVCGECHYKNEFRDKQFKFSWRRRTVADLFRHISETMPENAPGSLSSKQCADVVAYILSLNGVPAGSADLPGDAAVLDAYSLAGLSGH